MIERLLTVSGPLDEAEQTRLREVRTVLSDAVHQAPDVIRRAPGAVGPAAAPKRRLHETTT